MAKKRFVVGMLTGVLAFIMLLLGCSMEIEESWMGDHYGKLTIKNESSYSITEIKICEYSDESGLKTVDNTTLSANGSRTYQNTDGVKLEYTTFSLYGNFKTRHIKVTYNDNQKTKTVWLSEGHDVEVVVKDTELVVTDPIYDPAKRTIRSAR